MNVQLVKTASGSRLRDPKTRAVLPNVDDADSKPLPVDLDDPHWFRALACGDIVVIEADAEASSPAPAAPPSPSLPAPSAAPAAPGASSPAPSAPAATAPAASSAPAPGAAPSATSSTKAS